MDSKPAPVNKKRSIQYVRAQELAAKLKSKQDFVVYLDQHRKYSALSQLTPSQYSTTSPTRL